ncbi:MAG TPA: hypothetical protein VMY78_07850, partial [Solirubrobacteraceae bacterium]|nr:hypothetical protein [Solirubrobacteraceae bacterium]
MKSTPERGPPLALRDVMTGDCGAQAATTSDEVLSRRVITEPTRRAGGRASPTTEGEGMTEYDSRTDTGIPTEPVGSLPRPAKLQAAYAEYDEGKISK